MTHFKTSFLETLSEFLLTVQVEEKEQVII